MGPKSSWISQERENQLGKSSCLSRKDPWARCRHGGFPGIRWVEAKCCCHLVSRLYLTLCNFMTEPARLLCPWDFPGKNTGVVCHSLLQGIFPTQGLNPGLPHCRQILYQLSHQGSPVIWPINLLAWASAWNPQILCCLNIFSHLSGFSTLRKRRQRGKTLSFPFI